MADEPVGLADASQFCAADVTSWLHLTSCLLDLLPQSYSLRSPAIRCGVIPLHLDVTVAILQIVSFSLVMFRRTT